MAAVPTALSVLPHIVLPESLARLLMSCALGGVVGFEREWRHRDSGLRTNMLIAMGAALFTIMSAELAGPATADKSRVASNIVQGIGFLGAGLILHTRNRVLGLTSAATVFVVAAIGMTCGDGMYLTALCATGLLLCALQVVGALENKLGRKRIPMLYEVRAVLEGGAIATEDVGGMRGAAERRMYTAILKVLDSTSHRLDVLSHDNLAGLERICFSVLATSHVHSHILRELRASDATDQVIVFRDREDN